jgi:hypothetical protein
MASSMRMIKSAGHQEVCLPILLLLFFTFIVLLFIYRIFNYIILSELSHVLIPTYPVRLERVPTPKPNPKGLYRNHSKMKLCASHYEKLNNETLKPSGVHLVLSLKNLARLQSQISYKKRNL